MHTTRSVRNRRTIVAALIIASTTAISGCSLLSDDGNELTSDQVPADADQQSITADTIEDTSNSSNDQSTLDNSSSTTASGLEEGSSADQTSTAPPTPNDFCEARKRNNFDIRFAAGASTETMNSLVPADEVDLYKIEVGAGQIMNLRVSSAKDNAVAGIAAPDGSVVPGRFVEQRVAPTQGGIYNICISPGEGSVSYELTVSVIDDNTPTKVSAEWCGDSVNERGVIRFIGGSFSGRVEDAVIRGERDLYTLEASAGQTLDVLLTSLEDNAVFALRSPSGKILIDETSDFRFPLPEDGNYQFCIGSSRGNASYTMDVRVD